MPMETVVAFSLIDVLFLITIFFMFSLQNRGTCDSADCVLD